MAKEMTLAPQNGKGLKIGIVKAAWNSSLVDALYEHCAEALRASGVKEADIIVSQVPGSFELVFGAKQMIETHKLDAVVCIGVLIKGETAHFDHLAAAVSNGIMELNARGTTPVIFGVLTCLTEVQARERAVGEKSLGYGWGLSAVQMGLLRKTR